MKKIIIKGATLVTDIRNQHSEKIIETIFEGPEEMDASDGYHTFTELYEHRIELFISLCRVIALINNDPEEDVLPVWRSKTHSDGTAYDGWFILGINKEIGKQITYHLPLSRWEETDFALTFEKAPEFDGHTSKDVIERIKML